MEPEVREFLVKIMQSISMGLLWLLINMTIGIYFGFAFFDDGPPSTGNYSYYLFLIVSGTLLFLYLKKKWKGWDEINY